MEQHDSRIIEAELTSILREVYGKVTLTKRGGVIVSDMVEVEVGPHEFSLRYAIVQLLQRHAPMVKAVESLVFQCFERDDRDLARHLIDVADGIQIGEGHGDGDSWRTSRKRPHYRWYTCPKCPNAPTYNTSEPIHHGRAFACTECGRNYPTPFPTKDDLRPFRRTDREPCGEK